MLLAGANATATVTLGSGASTATNYRMQVVCTNPINIPAREAAAQAAGYPTYTEFVASANCTRFFIGALPTTATTAERQTFKDEVVAQGLAGTDAIWKLISITVGTTVYHVALGASSVDSDGPAVLSADAPVTINGVSYRGAGEAIRNSAGTLAGVNVVPLEQYLYGVVPRELGPTIWGNRKPRKRRPSRRAPTPSAGSASAPPMATICSLTTADQVYGGFAAEHPVSSAAVDATRGVVPTFGGAVIEALFFSTSGGWTANNEDVFSSSAIAYLRGVRDRGSHDRVLDDLERAVNPRQLRRDGRRDFEYGQSDSASLDLRVVSGGDERGHHRLRQDAAGRLCQRFGRRGAGDQRHRSDRSSGRIKTVEYVTEQGTFSDSKDQDARSSLRYFNDSGVKTNLPSTLVLLRAKRQAGGGHHRPGCEGEHRRGHHGSCHHGHGHGHGDTDECEEEGAIVGWTAYGGGFGHGVGMSQTGAAGMAESGRTVEEILHHYYQEIELTPWY